MATARDVIKRSMRILGVTASGETPSSAEISDGLTALNEMIESFSTENLIIPNVVREEFTLVSGTQSYSIGSGATFNTTRPLDIESATLENQAASPTSEYKLRILNSEEWARIETKDETSDIPTCLYYEQTYANGTINLWPKPSAANKLVLYSKKPLTSFSSANDTVTLPPGYLRMLAFNLAVEWASEFGKAVSGEVFETARESKANIKRQNIQPIMLECDPAVLHSSPAFNWRLGE